MIPLFAGEEVCHIVVLQTMTRGRILAKEYIPRLQLLGEILVNALGRKNADDSLRESEARLSLAAASARAALWTLEAQSGHTWITNTGRELLGFAPVNRAERLSVSRVPPSCKPHREARDQYAFPYLLRLSPSGVLFKADYVGCAADGRIPIRPPNPISRLNENIRFS
jgi:PAS domain-containing protein